jgi:hypothetical protein
MTSTKKPKPIEEHQKLEMEAKYGPQTGAYGLRPCKKPSSSHMLIFSSRLNVMYNAVEDPTDHTILSQYSMKKGLKVFSKRGANAMLTELQQLHNRKVMVPKDANKLTHKEKKVALEYLIFQKEKQCGKIKGRGYANGRKQQEFLNKEDMTSPTVMMESVMLSCMIDAKEAWSVAMANIPGHSCRWRLTKPSTYCMLDRTNGRATGQG